MTFKDFFTQMLVHANIASESTDVVFWDTLAAELRDDFVMEYDSDSNSVIISVTEP